jgi:hypothetical protein
MKKKKPNYYAETIVILQDLKKTYPSYSIGKHIATALGDYNDIWGLSDKEILFAFTKYRAQLQMDIPHETDEEELQKIIHDGMNLSSIFNEDDDG